MDVSSGLSVVQTVLQLPGSPIWTEIQSLLGVESQLDKLKITMSTIKAVLLDAEEQDQLQQHRRSYVEQDRFQRLKEAVYRADDLFDEIATLAHRNKLKPFSNKPCNGVCLFFSPSNQLRSAFNWSHELEKIREMLDDFVKDHRYNIGPRHPVGLGAARETHSYVCEEDDIIGRDDDKQKVIDMLLNTTAEEQDVSVISIVGIGGLGKTTLAQLVYNDKKIKSKFPLKMWVCVSDDFNVKALLGQILAVVKSTIKQDGKSLDQLQMDLRKELDGKKYLLVLDDVWNEDPSKWHELRKLLIGGERASRIIVTTRSKKVAEVVASHQTHELKGLSDEDSWNLFESGA